MYIYIYIALRYTVLLGGETLDMNRVDILVCKAKYPIKESEYVASMFDPRNCMKWLYHAISSISYQFWRRKSASRHRNCFILIRIFYYYYANHLPKLKIVSFSQVLPRKSSEKSSENIIFPKRTCQKKSENVWCSMSISPMWRFPKMLVPPNHPFLSSDFLWNKPSSDWGTPMTMETPT